MTQQAMTAGVPVEANKALIRRFIEEVHNKGNFAVFNELFAPNYVNHSAPANQNDRAAREQGIRSYRAAARHDRGRRQGRAALDDARNGAGPAAHAARHRAADGSADLHSGGQYLPHRQRADRGRMDRLGYAKLGATARVPDAAITSPW